MRGKIMRKRKWPSSIQHRSRNNNVSAFTEIAMDLFAPALFSFCPVPSTPPANADLGGDPLSKPDQLRNTSLQLVNSWIRVFKEQDEVPCEKYLHGES